MALKTAQEVGISGIDLYYKVHTTNPQHAPYGTDEAWRDLEAAQALSSVQQKSEATKYLHAAHEQFHQLAEPLGNGPYQDRTALDAHTVLAYWETFQASFDGRTLTAEEMTRVHYRIVKLADWAMQIQDPVSTNVDGTIEYSNPKTRISSQLQGIALATRIGNHEYFPYLCPPRERYLSLTFLPATAQHAARRISFTPWFKPHKDTINIPVGPLISSTWEWPGNEPAGGLQPNDYNRLVRGTELAQIALIGEISGHNYDHESLERASAMVFDYIDNP